MLLPAIVFSTWIAAYIQAEPEPEPEPEDGGEDEEGEEDEEAEARRAMQAFMRLRKDRVSDSLLV